MPQRLSVRIRSQLTCLQDRLKDKIPVRQITSQRSVNNGGFSSEKSACYKPHFSQFPVEHCTWSGVAGTAWRVFSHFHPPLIKPMLFPVQLCETTSCHRKSSFSLHLLYPSRAPHFSGIGKNFCGGLGSFLAGTINLSLQCFCFADVLTTLWHSALKNFKHFEIKIDWARNWNGRGHGRCPKKSFSCFVTFDSNILWSLSVPCVLRLREKRMT